MKILAIETSCDETAIAILECAGDEQGATFGILGNALHSQVDTHREFGGVFPAVAKREHAKNLTPLLQAALTESTLLEDGATGIPAGFDDLLSREYELATTLRAFLETRAIPDIDAIAVTHGPGLEPALWVGINFAKALAHAWQKPLIPINHMEGHMLVSSVAKSGARSLAYTAHELPLLGLLISGGHTELIEMHEWLSYRLLGETRDDAVGEAFDKVARMLDLPYPGGPEISKLAEAARADGTPSPFTLPKPMIDSGDLDFSFSGLKTAVMYLIKDRTLDEFEKMKLAQAFEDAVADVLYAKTAHALADTGAKSLLIGGGVAANTHIARVFTERLATEFPHVTLLIPDKSLTGDNAIMIGVAGYFRALKKDYREDFVATGTLSLV